jgi:chromosome segregation protein
VHLKRLEIHGFKSFADKTSLEFKPGVTIVVGPNGSGKSNIADAVRWVLGEQSVKSLRGGKMEDVIFAGSEKRRSLGMAEVSLTIDNTSGVFPLEFNEVTVTRRLYRSGESDYLINRVPCRLRDIHELFMDTGVGREGISIIGQGKVDEILSVRPEERRGLIEEAAGIVKYRHRKKEATRKLEDTDTSLIRLNDIVGELLLQQEPLFEQARVAKIYKEQKTELDGLEIGLLVEEMTTSSRRLQNIEKNRQNQDQEIEEHRTKYLEAQSYEEEKKLLLQKKDEEISSQQEKIYMETLRLEKNESEMNLITERISNISTRRKTFRHDIQQLIEEIETLNREYETQKTSGEDLRKKLQIAQEELQNYEQFLSKDLLDDQELSQRLDDLKNGHFEVLQEETQVNNELNSLKQRLANIEKQQEYIRSKSSNATQEMDTVNGTISNLEKEALDLLSVQTNIKEQMQEKEKSLHTEEKRQIELTQQDRIIQDERNSLTARLRVIKEMEREGQGYAHGVREVLRCNREGLHPGIIGTVAQVLNVPKMFEIAAEIALGGALQNIITENETAAQKAIEWLKANEKGRVTFLPLTTVNGKKPQENLPSGKGVLGRLSELLQYDSKYTGILEYLVGRVFVVENLSIAITKAKETSYRYRIVTLDGQLINAGGSMTGGSIKQNASGILGRKRNLKELEANIEKLDKEIITSQLEIEKVTSLIVGKRKSVAEFKETLQELHIRFAENKKTQERWGAERTRFKTELETIIWQIEEGTKERSSILEEIDNKEKANVVIKKTIHEKQEEVKSIQGQLNIKQAERIKKNEKLTQMRIEVATIEEKMSAFQKEDTYLSQRLKHLTQYKHDKEKESQDLKNKRIQMENAYQELEAQKKRQMTDILEFEKQMEDMKSNRYSLHEEINEIFQNIKRISVQLKEKEDKLHQYDIQQSKYETALEAVVQRLNEQYSLNLEEAKKQSPQDLDRRTAQQRIIILKEEIGTLGEVNLGAIEEYKKLVERLEFLTNQIEDMTEAKQRLQEVIREMNQIMIRKFQETYVKVDKAFQEMFIKMFSGGRAQLSLTEADSVLEAGVEIIAQPPGKKTQHLSLLSGGEKALTAIALLLAVLKVKPSPFCILDEIESNLDEANVNNFAKILKEFSDETQFIVISHRKGTMEIAHVLYGVTIEETGVSSLVSVKLEEAKKVAS